MNKKVVFKVISIRDYRGGAEDIVQTYVRVDQFLYEGEAFAEMDSTVYDLDDFKDIHAIYVRTAQCSTNMAYQMNDNSLLFEYDYKEWTNHVNRLKREIMALNG